MLETKKSMDQVGEEAAQIYKDHLGAAAVAEAMNVVADERVRVKRILARDNADKHNAISADHEIELATIEGSLVSPTVEAGEKHFKENVDAYHRIAAMEDYDRSQAAKHIAVEQPNVQAEQIPVDVQPPVQR